MAVVSDVITDNGIGGTFQKKYTYKQALFHKLGRGFLGFREVKITNYQKNTITYNRYNVFDLNINSKKYYYFPYLKESQRYTFVNGAQGGLIKEIQNKMDVLHTITGNNYIYFPVVTRSVRHNWDLDGSFISTHTFVQSTSDMDIYGNQKKLVYLDDPNNQDTLASEGNFQFKTTINKTYQNDVENWLIGRPLSVKITKGGKNISNTAETTVQTDYGYYNHGETAWPLLKYKKTVPVKTDPSSPDNYGAYSVQHNYNYDKYGNIIKETMSAPLANPAAPNKVTNFVYDMNNAGRFLTKIIKSSEGSDYITQYVYDSKNGKIVKQTDPAGLETTYQYDDFGRMIKAVLPDGTTSETQYVWSQGNADAPAHAVYYVKHISTGMSPSFEFHDRLRRMLRMVTPGMDGAKTYADNYYDDKGFLNQTTAPYFSTSQADPATITTYVYDDLGRIKSKTNSAVSFSYDYMGRTTKTTNGSTQKSTTKEVDALGELIHVTDPSGTINYYYNSAGKIKSIEALGHTTKLEYDPAGNRKKLVDPNTGITTYQYNAFGELIAQTDSRNNKYTMSYDLLGRLHTKTLVNGNETTTYSYNNTSGLRGFGQLKLVNGSNGTVYRYTYDNLNRLISKTETIDGTDYTFTYHYNTTGQLDNYTFPSGLAIKYDYNSFNGKMKTVTQGTKVLWNAIGSNALGQLTDYSFGNGLATHKDFDSYGMTKEIITGNVQDLSYDFDPATGNLNYRKDKIYNLTETFGYDTMLKSRLTSWQVNNAPAYHISYMSDGRMNTKTDITTYKSVQYTNNNYAVDNILAPDLSYLSQATKQDISYTAFNKIKTIKQHEPLPDSTHYYKEEFYYGPGNRRKKTVLYHDTILLKTKFYIGSDYEIEKDASGHQRKLHYLYAGDGLFAIFVQNEGTDSMYYIHKDYLGSYQTITDAGGHVVERLSFDPWGRRRNAQDWSFNNVPSSYLFDRGFTGHEHMAHFSLINMNGRVYDPVLGSFLSPDPFVQGPSNPQNYNRYAYSLNNPLKYTDPSGYQTAPAPGASNWLGGGGGMGESGTDFSENVNWNYFDDQNYYTNWKGVSVAYNDDPPVDLNQEAISEMLIKDAYGDGYMLIRVPGGFSIVGYWDNKGDHYSGMFNNRNIFLVSSNGADPVEIVAKGSTGGGDGLNGKPKHDAITYGLFGTGVWANTVKAGFDAAKRIQPTVSTWAKGSRIFGRGSNILSGVTIGYDFATGTANTSTLVNIGVTVAGEAVVIVVGAGAAPYVVGAGIIYGVISVAGGDEWLNSNFDMSNQINFIKP